MEDFYTELLERLEALKYELSISYEQFKRDHINGRITELQTIIIRVQQIILKDINLKTSDDKKLLNYMKTHDDIIPTTNEEVKFILDFKK